MLDLDFTLKSYSEYIQLIKAKFKNILRFDEYFAKKDLLTSFCIIRHDVDRNPDNALRMAELENDAGICSTYFFRAKKQIFNKAVVKKISRLGHEIGYHYESLCDAKGDYDLALSDFEKNLNRLRHIVNISTVSMHGRPLSPYDSRNLW